MLLLRLRKLRTNRYRRVVAVAMAMIAVGVASGSGVASSQRVSVAPPALAVPQPKAERPAVGSRATDAVSQPRAISTASTTNVATTSAPVVAKLPKAPPLSTVAYVLMDVETGRVLMAQREHDRRAPASLTKIVTGIVALKSGDLDSVARVSARAAAQPSQRLGLTTGERVPLSSLLCAALMMSGNDAASAVAEHVGGSEAAFARMMNKFVVQVGAHDSNFVNPHGLDAPSHYSTAYDLALLSRYALGIPEFVRIVSSDRMEIVRDGRKSDVANINSFLWRFKGALGIKTGYTSKAGYSVSVAAQQGSQALVAVLLGCPSSESRWDDAIRLMEYGFENYETLMALAQRPPEEYVVRAGDTLSGIAKRHGTTLAALLAANPSLRGNPSLIKVGQRLSISANSSKAAATTPQRTYVVRKGDSLSSIAKAHGTTVAALLTANPDLRGDPNLIKSGQLLKLP